MIKFVFGSVALDICQEFYEIRRLYPSLCFFISTFRIGSLLLLCFSA